MDTEKQRQCKRNDLRLTESGDTRSEQLLVMPTESLLTNGEWLPGELLSGSECRMPSWFLDMNIRLVCSSCEIIPLKTFGSLHLLTCQVAPIPIGRPIQVSSCGKQVLVAWLPSPSSNVCFVLWCRCLRIGRRKLKLGSTWCKGGFSRLLASVPALEPS